METKNIQFNSSEALVILHALQHEVKSVMLDTSSISYQTTKVSELVELHSKILCSFDDLLKLYGLNRSAV